MELWSSCFLLVEYYQLNIIRPVNIDCINIMVLQKLTKSEGKGGRDRDWGRGRGVREVQLSCLN